MKSEAPSLDRWFCGLLVAALIVFYFPGLLPGRVLLPLDILCQWVPWSGLTQCAGRTISNPVPSDQVYAYFPWWAAVRAGRPGGLLWNPQAFAGSPMLGNGQSALLYPPNWLHLLLPPTWSYVLLAMLRTGLAVGFTWSFARRRVSAPAAALAAATYSFSFTFVSCLGYPLGDVIALLPALVWAVDARRWVLLAILTALELLAGQPEGAAVVFLVVAAYFVASRPPYRQVWRAAAAVGIGALCASPQLFASYQYLRLSAAIRLRSEYNPIFYSAHTLLEFLTPQFFGSSYPREAWASNEGGYFGLLPALLVLAWLLNRPRHAMQQPFLWVFLGSLALIYRVPPFSWVLHLPLLRAVFVTKFWMTATFAAAMLAASALDQLYERRIRFGLLYALAVASSLVLLYARWHFSDFISALGLRAFESRVLAQFAVLLAISLLTLRFRPSLAAVVMLVDSYVYLGHFNTVTPASLLYPRTPVVDFVSRDPERARIMADGVLPPNTAAVYGLEDVRGYDAITPWRYFRYMTAIDASFPDLAARLDLRPGIHRQTLFNRDRFERPLREWGEGFRDFLHRAYYWNDRLARLERPALFDLLNVKYYLVPHGGKLPPGADGYQLRYSNDVDVYENPHRLPRAFVVGRWHFVADEQSEWAAIRAPDFDPRRTAILCCRSESPGRVPTEFHAAEILSYAPGEVSIRAAGPGALVLADADYPGWQTPGYVLYRADYMFRGVLLPAGEHIVRFTYRLFP